MNDKEKFKKILDECYELFIERYEKYGDSWKVLSVQSTANLCEMKMNRIARLGHKVPKTEDEFKDNINYSVFALMKLNEEK